MSSFSKYDLRVFDQKKFTAEIRAFMKKHKVKTRDFPKTMNYPYAPFRRLESGRQGITIKAAQRLIRTMEEYGKPKTQRRIAPSKRS